LQLAGYAGVLKADK